MKKSMISLTLLLSLLATTGCSESAKAKKDDNGNDVMYTYNDTNVTADDVYADLLDSTAGSKAIFDTVYKKVIQSTMELDANKERNKEIEKEVDEETIEEVENEFDEIEEEEKEKEIKNKKKAKTDLPEA